MYDNTRTKRRQTSNTRKDDRITVAIELLFFFMSEGLSKWQVGGIFFCKYIIYADIWISHVNGEFDRELTGLIWGGFFLFYFAFE